MWYLGDWYDEDEWYADILGRSPDAEGYSARPIPESNTRVGSTHHPDCPDPESWECCKALWEAKYQEETEAEIDATHREWWQ